MTAASIASFLNAVLPTQGVYVYTFKPATAPEGDKMKQKVALSIADLLNLSAEFYNYPIDVWFALASYKQGWHTVQTKDGERMKLRTHDNALAAKALWLDIDVGEGKGYTTRAEALADLKTFCEKSSLPCPWVVASGATGVHLYWALSQEVNPQEWQYLADRLRAACEELGLRADPMRTRDISSIMRLPGTWNMKGGMDNPALVQVLVAGSTMPYGFYKEKLDAFVPKKKTSIPEVVKLDVPDYIRDRQADAALMRYFQLPQPEYPERDAADIVAGCKQIRTMNDGKEPTWRASLSVLRFCKGGREMAEKLSTNPKWHSEYNIDSKMAWLEANDIKPMHCKTFAEYRPEGCEGCPFAGMITSPISVPKAPLMAQESVPPAPKSETPASDPAPESEAATAPEKQEEDLSSAIPTFDYPTVRVNEAGCFVREKSADDEWRWRQIYPYPVYPVQRIKARDTAGEVKISYIFRKHHQTGYDDIQIPGETLLGTGLNGYLGSVGFLLQDKDRKLMGNMLIELLKQTSSTIAETTVSDQLGWDEHCTSFLLGNRLYKTDGSVIEISPKGKAAIFSAKTCTRGDLDTWKAIANTYNKKGMEWGQATLAAAFASPLMPFGALESAAMLFLTGEGGSGKSAALAVGISVFGDPSPRTGLMINKDDTYLARFAKLGIMNNIAVGFDEMTDLTPKEASDMAYQLTQGRGKDRMAANGEGLQLNTTYWSCLPVMSANDSMMTNLANHSRDATAQMSRVLEIRVTPISEIYTPEEFEANERLLRKLPQNYGTAGDVYMRYVTTHLKEIDDYMFEMEKRIRKHLNIGASYRFWTYMTTRMMTGIVIAKQLGLVDYDIDALFNYLMNLVKSSREALELHKFNPEAVVASFMRDQSPHRLVVAAHKRPKDMPDVHGKGSMNDINYVKKQPAMNQPISIRYEVKEERAFISMEAISKWCKTNNISVREFLQYIGQVYKADIRAKKEELGALTVHRATGAENCICVYIPYTAADEAEDGEDNLNGDYT